MQRIQPLNPEGNDQLGATITAFRVQLESNFVPKAKQA